MWKPYLVPACLFAIVLLAACGETESDSQGPSLNDDTSGVGLDGIVTADGQGPGADGTGPTWTPMAEGDPGRVTLHRLNRAEYDNTVRDLLGTDLRPARDFPDDDHGYGYDNIADVLTMSPLLFELYERAADVLLGEALSLPIQASESWHFEAEEVESTVGGATGGSAWNIWSNGEVYTAVQVPASGDSAITAWAYGQQAGPDPVHMAFYVDGLAVAEFDVTNGAGDYQSFSATVPIASGLRNIAVGFTNDYYEPDLDEDRNLVLDWFELAGPIGLSDADKVNPAREKLITCDPTAGDAKGCARTVVGDFGRRAWRRPLTGSELDGLMGLYDLALAEGDGFEEGLRLALKGLLVSHHFVYRVELDEDPESLDEHLVADHELASRLSYFLWSSAPDEELLALADAGALQDHDELERQARRMLTSPRAAALADNFAGQWLYIRALDDAAPDVWYFDGWNEALRDAMRAEAWLTFHAFIREDRSLLDLIGGTTSFVNDVLAEYYEMEDFYALPGTFVEADMASVHRGGVIRQGALLTSLSNPTRTSPVRRGKWVLGHLLCSEPPPPPPGVEGLIEDDVDAKSLKEILAVHREDPVCAACHDAMDPIGLGLENFDGMGRWRDADGGGPIDASGVMPGDLSFDNGAEMIALVRDDERLPGCMVEQLMTYALGRGLESSDNLFVEDIAEEFILRGHRFEELAVLIVQSKPFRMRHGQVAGEASEEAP